MGDGPPQAVSSNTDQAPKPPGQERSYPKPTKTGKIPFKFEKTGLQGETSYKVWGDLSSSSKVPLILLHGGPGATHNYLLPVSLINKDYDIPVIMYDQIGCGDSTRFKDRKGDGKFWTPELFMAELDNLKSYLGIKTFDLLGQSWGGMLGGQYAIGQPPGLRKLIISDSPSDMVVWVKVANELRAKLPKDVRETLERCEKEGRTDTEEYEEAVLHFYRRHVCRVVPFPPEMNAVMDALSEDNTVYETMNGPSEFYVVGTLKTWSITDQLRQITDKTVPGGILVMNGYFDEAQDETTAPFFTKPSCRTKWVRYPLSSHMPMLEETESYVKDLGTFLTSE